MLSVLGSTTDQFQRFPLSVHYRSDESIWFLLRVNLSLTQITKRFKMGILLTYLLIKVLVVQLYMVLYRQKMCSSLMVLKEKNIFRFLKRLNYLLDLCNVCSKDSIFPSYQITALVQRSAKIAVPSSHFLLHICSLFPHDFYKPFVVGENSLRNLFELICKQNNLITSIA